MMHPTEIERILREKIPQCEAMARDLTGTLDHFEVTVVSPAFNGLGMVQQHQLIYAALKEELKGAIHALSLKTFTPEAWSQLNKPRGIS